MMTLVFTCGIVPWIIKMIIGRRWPKICCPTNVQPGFMSNIVEECMKTIPDFDRANAKARLSGLLMYGRSFIGIQSIILLICQGKIV